jgi:hypothetical protein
MKKIFLLACCAVVLVPLVALLGCGSSSSTATTTTTTNTTTTTGTPIGAISGTITLPGVGGYLWIGATTDGTLTTTEGWLEKGAVVTASQATYDYTIPIYTAGTYYVVGQLCIGKSVFSDPVSGDRLGEYADGGLPVGYGKTPVGSPAPIAVTSGIETSKNFELKVTW